MEKGSSVGVIFLCVGCSKGGGSFRGGGGVGRLGEIAAGMGKNVFDAQIEQRSVRD